MALSQANLSYTSASNKSAFLFVRIPSLHLPTQKMQNCTSISPRRAKRNELFPLPTVPTIATNSPRFTWKFMPSKFVRALSIEADCISWVVFCNCNLASLWFPSFFSFLVDFNLLLARRVFSWIFQENVPFTTAMAASGLIAETWHPSSQLFNFYNLFVPPRDSE